MCARPSTLEEHKTKPTTPLLAVSFFAADGTRACLHRRACDTRRDELEKIADIDTSALFS
jgi:hypothetical protein